MDVVSILNISFQGSNVCFQGSGATLDHAANRDPAQRPTAREAAANAALAREAAAGRDPQTAHTPPQKAVMHPSDNLL